MSANKNKYYRVITSKIVSAPNKAEAQVVAKRVRNSTTSVEQITAATAQALTASA